MTLEQFTESFPTLAHAQVEFSWNGDNYKLPTNEAVTFLGKKRQSSRSPYAMTPEELRVGAIYSQEYNEWHQKVEEWFSLIGVTFDEVGEYDDRCVYMERQGHPSIEVGSLSKG